MFRALEHRDLVVLNTQKGNVVPLESKLLTHRFLPPNSFDDPPPSLHSTEPKENSHVLSL